MCRFRLLEKFNFLILAVCFLLLSPTLAQSAVTSLSGTIATNFTFAQGETYLVTGPVTMRGVTTIEGGATIKFDSTGSLDISDPVFNTSSSEQATFTSENDDSVGEVVTGSTGSPTSYPNALTLPKGNVRFAQIRYADEGIVFPGNETLTVRDSKFFAVGTPVNASSSTGPATVNLNNLLIAQGANGPVLSDSAVNALTVTATNLTMAHLADVGFDNTMTATGSSLNVTDSLFVDIQGLSVFSGTAPSTENFNAFFQTPQNGAGANDVVLTTDPILTDFFLDQASAVINAGSQLASAAGLYHYNTNTDGTIEGPTTVDIGYHASPSINQFSVLATNSIWLKSNSMVSGDIGVNEATAGPFLDSNVALAVGHDMVIPAAINLRADSIKIKTGAVANGNVYHNQLENNGTITGAELTPIVFPILDVLPLFRTATLGTVSDINVAAGTTHVLAPGDYGVITVNDNATLQFTGGLYQVQKIDAKKTTSLLFDAPSEVRIVENLVTKRFSNLGPSAGATLNAGDIQFFVEGTDVGNQRAVDFGHTHTVVGHFYAPNGTLSLKRQSTFTGIFLAKDVMIGHDSQVVLDPGTGQPIVSAPAIQPNGGSFTDAVDVNIATITSGATIHFTVDGTDPTTASPVFTAPLTFIQSVTVKALAVRENYQNSSIATSNFVVETIPQVDPVVFNPDPTTGPFLESVDIDLSSTTEDATIYFTDDGSTPTTNSRKYVGPFTLIATATIKAIAVKPGFQDSVVISADYTVDENSRVESVIYSPIPQVFQNSIDVTLSTPTPDATIHYTLDGLIPTTSSPVFTTPITLTQTTTIIAAAMKQDFLDSFPNSETYTVESDLADPLPLAGPLPVDPVSFYSFEFVEEKGRDGHEDLFPIAGFPIKGTNQMTKAQLHGPVDTAAFRLVTPTGVDIQAITLSPPPGADSFNSAYFGLVQFPDQPFQVAASGLNRDGTSYNLTFPTVFETKTVGFNNLDRPYTLPEGTTTINVDLTNHENAGTFMVTGADDQGFISRVEPELLTLGAGQTGQVEVDILVPVGTPEFTLINVALTASDTTNPDVSNTENEGFFVLIPPTITPPADITTPSTGTLTPVDIGTATATDNKGIHSITNDAPEDGFPLGATEVTWTAIDITGQRASAVQLITITSP